MRRLGSVVWLALATCPAWAGALPLENFAQSDPGPGWPRWGKPLGEAATACEWSVEKQGKVKVGRLGFRAARGTVLLPMPEVPLNGRPTALTMRVLGDGSGAALSVTLLDTNGEWLATPGVPVTWRGWRAVKLDLTRFARTSRGDEDGVLDPPATLWSFNVEFGLPMDGALCFADMALSESAWLPFDYLDTLLAGPTQCRVYRPEDRPPQLVLANRSKTSLPVAVDGTVAGEPVRGELLVNPQSTSALDLPRVAATGPVELVATLRCGRDKREVRYRYGVLPRIEALPGRFFGLGSYTLDDLADGRLLKELPDLRVAAAGWTVLSLRRSMGDAPLTADEWTDAEAALNVTQAFGLRIMAEVSAEALLTAAPAGQVARASLQRCAPYLAGALVDARRLAQTDAVEAAVRSARALLPEGRTLLVRAAQAPTSCDSRLVDLPPAVEAPPGPFPRAWRALAGLLDGPDARPAWLLAEYWPTSELTGCEDPAAAAALTAIAARCVPRVEAAALGRLLGRENEWALLHSSLTLSEPFLAWAVAARQLAGLDPEGVSEIEPGLFEMKASGPRRLRVLWSETEKRQITSKAGEIAWDHLGRRLGGHNLEVSFAPVYLVTEQPLAGPLR